MIAGHWARSDTSQFLFTFQGPVLQKTDHVIRTNTLTLFFTEFCLTTVAKIRTIAWSYWPRKPMYICHKSATSIKRKTTYSLSILEKGFPELVLFLFSQRGNCISCYRLKNFRSSPRCDRIELSSVFRFCPSSCSWEGGFLHFSPPAKDRPWKQPLW